MKMMNESRPDIEALVDLYRQMHANLSELVDSHDISVAVEARRMVAIIEATLRQYGQIVHS